MKKIRYIFVIFFVLLININIEAKMVNSTSESSLSSDLNIFYNSLNNSNERILSTNRFNCSSTGCTSSTFNNLGLLSSYEYEKLGGNKSYLYKVKPYYILDGTTIENLNGYDRASGLRPAGYLTHDTEVTGNGTQNDPWVIKGNVTYEVNITSSGGSSSITNAKVSGGETLTITLTPNTGYSTSGVTTTCKNGVINGNILTISNIKENLSCMVIFTKLTYTVSISSSTGSVTPSSISAEYGTSKTVSLTPKTGYTLTGATTTCKNGVISGSILKISNITQNIGCTVTFPKITYSYTVVGSGGTVSPRNGSVTHGSSLTFTLTPSSGYELEGSTTTCNGTISGSKLTISNITNGFSCTVTFHKIQKAFVAKLLEDNPTVKTRTDFSTVLETTTTGTIYKQTSTTSKKMTEDVNRDGKGEDVYYFAGNPTNNWVKVGTYSSDYYVYKGYESSTDTSGSYYEYTTLTKCKNGDGGFEDYYYNCEKYTYATAGTSMYWRIIRINEDNSIRLLYMGTSPTTSVGYIGYYVSYNIDYDHPKYFGYMYGEGTTLASARNNTTSSLYKEHIDYWYKNSLANDDKYISKTAIYCNDRSVSDGSYNTTKTAFYMGGYTRLKTNKTPTYKCGGNGTGGLFESTQATADKFSVSTSSGGNGKLTYPAALITADEAAYAGAVWGTAASTYLSVDGNGNKYGNNWKTMTPCYGSGLKHMCSMRSSSALSINTITGINAIRPVISLKACVKYSSGDGSISNPYQVTIDTTCSNQEN